jgi:8-oxo-dGTP pyrophosphatase MutT (NUDIX family)
MSVEQTENKGRPEQLVIPPDWKIEPVQPPPGRIFQPVELITPEEIEAALKLPPYKSEIDVSLINYLSNLRMVTSRSRSNIANCSPSLVTERGETRLSPPINLKALIEVREEHILWTSEDTAYLCFREQDRNEQIIKESLTLDSFISRLLIVAKQENSINFLCRPRGEESIKYKGLLDIPGGKLKLTEEAKKDLNNPPIVSGSRALTETFSHGAIREYLEEFGALIPAIQHRIGSFITFIIDEEKSFLEVTELALVSSIDLGALKMLGNYRRSQGASLGNEWQIKNIDSVLQEKLPILPTVFSSLSRLKGNYVYEHEGWQIYGEYIPYNQTSRGKEITLDSPLQG